MPASPIVQLLFLFVLGGVAFAAWKGGIAERAAAAIVLLNLIVGLANAALLPQFKGTTLFINDGVAALALLAVTLRFGAPWMGGVMFFYAAQFSLHSYYLVTNRPDNDYLHALINNINFIGIVWCLIIGTAVAWRRRAGVEKARTAAEKPAA